MKKMIPIVLFLMILHSCDKMPKQKRENKFHGIGEFIIGAKFDTLKSYKLFEKNSDSEFELEKFELTKEIGVVEDLTVKTQNGKIYSVSFKRGKFTNTFELDKYLIDFEETEFSREKKMNSDLAEYWFYETFDNKIGFNKQRMLDKELAVMYGYYAEDYSYNDLEIENKIREKEQTEKDSIEKAEYMEDVKSVK